MERERTLTRAWRLMATILAMSPSACVYRTGPLYAQGVIAGALPPAAAGASTEFQRGEWHAGAGLPVALPRGANGSALITPEIAVSIIENMVEGRPPFRPDLGVGGASWFVTEGNPYTGVSATHTIPISVELVDAEGGLRFLQTDLDRIFAEEEAKAWSEVEVQVRQRFRAETGREAPALLSNTLRERIARQVRGLAERRMWTRIGQQVAASPRQVGEVVLEPGGRFSASPGRFTLAADAARIRLRGGLTALLDALRGTPGIRPVPELEQSAAELTAALRVAGQVRSVLRIGGRILIVVAVAHDLYEIITAEDHLEATLVSATGWAGAGAASAGFSALWTPADTAGPWAWLGHGVGVLVSGGIGYWAGSSTTRYVYRLIVHKRGRVKMP